MTPPGLELHYSLSHRFCGARRSRNIRASSALPRRHSQVAKGGSRQAPPFCSRADNFESGLRRSLVMTVMTPAIAMPAMVAVMRGCWIGSLLLGGTRAFLWSGLHGRSLPDGYKKDQC